MADLLRRAPLQVVLHRTEQPGYAFESLRGAVLTCVEINQCDGCTTILP